MKHLNARKIFNSGAVCFFAINLFVSGISAQIQDELSKKKISVNNSSIQQANKLTAKKYKIRQEIFPYRIGATDIKIVVSKTSSSVSKFVYFNVHDNENTAVEAALEVVGKFGGTIIELQHDGERMIKFSLKNEAEKQFTFDPNRIFTPVGIRKTLEFNGDYSIEADVEVSKFAEKLRSYFKNAKLIIAVHNNTNENYSIKSYDKNGEYETDAQIVNINYEADIDDFFYVTENNFFKFFEQKNQNAARQNNSKVTDDGSLSVYCGRNKISYINVESEHGHLQEQVEMLELLQDLIKKQISAKRKPDGK